MNIAFMAHDKRKELMVQFFIAYSGILSKHALYSTAVTGRLVTEATGLDVTLFLSGDQGGSQQIGARVAYNEIDILIVFNDPFEESTLDAEIYKIIRHCDMHNIPVATNIATAEIIIRALDRGDLDWRNIVNPKNKGKQ